MNLYVIFPEYLFYQPKRKYNGQADDWWLRSPYYDGYAFMVYPDGYVSYNNHNVRNSYGRIVSHSPWLNEYDEMQLVEITGNVGDYSLNRVTYSYGKTSV